MGAVWSESLVSHSVEWAEAWKCKRELHEVISCSPFRITSLSGSHTTLTVQRAAAFVPPAEWEGRFVLGLCHFATQEHKWFNQGTPLAHRDLPQFHLLALGPLLSRVMVHPSLVLKITLVPQNHNGDLERTWKSVSFIGGMTKRLYNKRDKLNNFYCYKLFNGNVFILHR